MARTGSDAEFRRAWPWVPAADANGHSLGPGTVSVSYRTCRDCPANLDGRGHNTIRCLVAGCDAPSVTPPGHVGPLEAQR